MTPTNNAAEISQTNNPHPTPPNTFEQPQDHPFPPILIGPTEQ